ncbi:hypothetical protein FOXYS1_10878 [Fusarium oxysporum]|uniref:DNA2/NAM7 helicase-like C-terminal domain-containing protein n=1 Tax=Fusarium oxysporum TaxID=5507 RepID=A0A8H5A4C1_FUSOX|nr:hypothetical protein FOXYS1_10878 [Fusarium oxysporum]
MRRYIQRLQKQQFARKTQPNLVRSANYLEVHKVVDDLRKYTCDAMTGQEIHSDYKAMKKATEMAKRSDTFFTTCIGAGIGLIRSNFFDIVTVDEASQQTEPTTADCQSDCLGARFDVSLFERLYTKIKYSKGNGGLRALVLDTQYRMHPKLCEFSSGQFYEESGPEPESPSHSIVVLTPYTPQAEVLKRMLSSISYRIEVSSIDGFQGREADVIVFVTVRCKEHREIGFLKDMRRMNVALTRARSALIVVGSRVTLTEGTADEESASMWRRLLGSLTEVKLEVPVKGLSQEGLILRVLLYPYTEQA